MSQELHDFMQSGTFKNLLKESVKEGAKEWLSEQVTIFGWWSLKVVAAGIAVMVIYSMLWKDGWHK